MDTTFGVKLIMELNKKTSMIILSTEWNQVLQFKNISLPKEKEICSRSLQAKSTLK